MNGFTPKSADPQQPRGTILWWPGLCIVCVEGGLLVLLQSGLFSFTSRPSADFFYILWSAQAVLFLWIVAYSRLEAIPRVKLLIVIFLVELLLCVSFRLDGYAGDGRAILTWRWSPTPTERFQQSRQKKNADVTDDSQTQETEIHFATSTPTDFPAFRGADRSGIVHELELFDDWEQSPPQLLWRRQIGFGWSSFAVVGNHCVTQEQRGKFEAVVCYEVRTERECWVHRDSARFFEVTGGGGPRATPTIHNGRVYSLGATGLLNCLNGSNGKVIWSVDILKQHHFENRLFGMARSPLVIDEKVIVAPGAPGNSVVAYHQNDGKKLWGGGDAKSAYSSPQFAVLGRRRQVLNFNAEGMYSHDLSDGTVLWSIPWVSNPEERNNVCQPVVFDDDRLFISSGYGKGCGLFHIAQHNGRFTAKELWRNRNLKAKFTSVVEHEDFIYGLDEGILTCLNVKTGERQWKRGRYGHGQLILVHDLLLIQAESGDVVLVSATPNAFTEIARLDALDDRSWNHPALSGRYLLVRNDREAACYELPVVENEAE